MPEHEPQPFHSCDVCDRTILRGERVFEYVTADRERRGVCALCRERAEAGGWIRADSPAADAHPPEARRRRGQRTARLRERMRDAGERLRTPRRIEDGDHEEGPREPGREAPAPPWAPEVSSSPPAPAPVKPAAPQPAKSPTAAPATEPDTRERRMRRAISFFNESDRARVVAGLMRTLGDPRVAVHESSRRPPRVEVTVAWELSWYRWQVLADASEVRELAKGTQLSELEDSEPEWNASVDGEGKLHWR